MPTPIIEIDNLKKSYGDFEAVKGISFNVLEGEIFSLLGPNGAGKTTTISMLSCLLEPTDGDARLRGHSIRSQENGVKRAIGVVPQEIALYETLSGTQNLSFWGRMYGMGGGALKARIDEVLEQVGLTDRAGDQVETYSGGMKRRLNIAAGLLHRPAILFMDEPTVGIDPQSRRSILDMVAELRDEGMTILYTTHYMEEAEELSDRVGIIDHGQLIALGSQEELTEMVGSREIVRLHVSEQDDTAALAERFTDLAVVLQSAPAPGELALTVRDASAALAPIMARANDTGLHIRTVTIEEPNLEAVFLHLTGRALRD